MAKKTEETTTPRKATKSAKPGNKGAAPKKADAAPRTGAVKSATKSAAKSTAKPAEKNASSTTVKKAAKKASPTSASPSPTATSSTTKRPAPAVSPIKPPAPVITSKAPASKAIPQVVQSADAGIIRPATKRPAHAPTLNATAVYRQDRLLRAPGPDQRAYIRRDLPTEYGETRLSVLVRDANWLFMYWEISPETRAKLGIPRGGHREQLILRHYDLTGLKDEDVRKASSYFDVMVTDQTSSWYVQVPSHGRRYLVELGIARTDGTYTPVARSGAVQMPRMEISQDLNWKMDDNFSDAHFQILQLSGGGTDLIGRLGASEGLVSSQQSRLFSEGAGFSASLFSGALFSGEFSSGAIAGRQVFAGKDRQFWLTVDAEVIVYGATEPDALVKFMGREIKLNPDGTFGIRMALPDAMIEFPVEATSADGEETRRVRPVVTRETHRD